MLHPTTPVIGLTLIHISKTIYMGHLCHTKSSLLTTSLAQVGRVKKPFESTFSTLIF